jgi:A/G-specific adenine glycosylase
MLQQTRVAAVIPFYERFLERFPTPQSLAQAAEAEVLAHWAGLGYYSRARNLHRAAKLIAAAGAFPSSYTEIRALPGVGEYTAAAVASIAYGLPHAVVDGNVKRVAARLTNDALADVPAFAAQLLDRKDPARSNQALMELGALICLPRSPLCHLCPVAQECEANRRGTQAELPAKRERPAPEQIRKTLLLIRRGEKLLLVPSTRVRGFWELPEPFEGASPGDPLGVFRHTILNRHYRFEVREAIVRKAPSEGRWWANGKPKEITLSTAAKKALRCSISQDSRQP